jgi:hypothetical protein
MTQQHTSKQLNSWYLRTGQVHHFLCRCGQVDQVSDVLTIMHHPNHRCSNCGNTHYLDSVMFLTNLKVTRWSIFHWNVERVKNDEAWVVSAYANIPLFDPKIQKIRLKKVMLATMSLSFRGGYSYKEEAPSLLKKYLYNHCHSATQMSELIEKELSEVLDAFLLESPIHTLGWIEEETLPESTPEKRIKLYAFFLKHDHLKEYDFFYWKHLNSFLEISRTYPTVQEMLSFILNFRKEKSIRKACYKSYGKSMQKLTYYNPRTDYIFSHQIDDRNFLLQLINMNVKIKSKLFNELQQREIIAFFIFLKEHYSQKAITEFFLHMKSGYYLRDTVQMFYGEAADFIREHFHKVPLKINRLHDEFIRVGRLRKSALKDKKIFDYHENDLKAETMKDEFEYRLPATTHILQQWSYDLHNCMYGYSAAIHQSRSVIYGVFKEEKLLYAVEIRNNRIVQALGKYNKHIERKDKALIDAWFREVYILSWMGVSD